MGAPNSNDSAHEMLERDSEWPRFKHSTLKRACTSPLSHKNGDVDAKFGKHHGGDEGRRVGTGRD